MREFTVLLVSNASANTFPENRNTEFTTKLAEPIDLEANWKVAATSICYHDTLPTLNSERITLVSEGTTFTDELFAQGCSTSESNHLTLRINKHSITYTIKYIPNAGQITLKILTNDHDLQSTIARDAIFIGDHLKKDISRSISRNPSKELGDALTVKCQLLVESKPVFREFLLPTFRYETPYELVNALNKTVGHELFAVSSQRPNRLITQNIPNDCHILLRDGLNYILGFLDNELRENGHESEYSVQLDRGVFAAFIYSDIVKPSLVGDSLTPLLCSVPISNSKFGSVANYSMYKPEYRPVVNQKFETITIKVCDANGRLLSLNNSSHFMITLHFKQE